MIHDLGVLQNHIGSEVLSATVKYIPVQLTKRMLGSKTTRAKYIKTIIMDPQCPFIWESFHCRASVRRGTHLRTFQVFAWTLVGLSRTDVVSIGLSYLILSVRTYSSRTCSRDTLHQRTTTISQLTPSVLTLFLSFFVLFPSLSRTLRHSCSSITSISSPSSDSRALQAADDPNESLS